MPPTKSNDSRLKEKGERGREQNYFFKSPKILRVLCVLAGANILRDLCEKNSSYICIREKRIFVILKIAHE